MNAIHQIKEAGFTLELLPNDKLGVRPNTLTQQQRDYLKFNKSEIVQQLQIQMMGAWLHKIGEPEEDHYLVIDKCKSDSDAMEYFLKHARGEFETGDISDLTN